MEITGIIMYNQVDTEVIQWIEEFYLLCCLLLN